MLSRSVWDSDGEPKVAVDRAAISVSRDMTFLQAARQLNLVVRRLNVGWRKRVQDIAARAPDKLHPIIQRARSAATDPCWDRASWQQSPVAGGRPIHLVLAWLATKSLLTPLGKASLSQAERLEYANLQLGRTLVAPAAASFLDRHYRDWYDSDGVNFAVDHVIPFNFASLEARWQSYIGK